MRKTLKRPPKISPADDNGYFSELAKVVFRADFSWAVITEKWGGFVQRFDGFNLICVAAYGPDDLRTGASSGIGTR